MKKLLFAKLILSGLILLFTACKKDTGMPEFSAQTDKGIAVNVKNDQVTIKLIGLEGFSDPCFNMSMDTVFQQSFRFTGGSNTWNYSSLTSGLHSFSFSCLHECTHENGSEIMKFEIDDGKSQQKINARETRLCKYEFLLNLN